MSLQSGKQRAAEKLLYKYAESGSSGNERWSVALGGIAILLSQPTAHLRVHCQSNDRTQ